MVSKTLLAELKQIIFEDYGVSLSDVDIFDIGNSLVNFFELLIRIDTQAD